MNAWMRSLLQKYRYRITHTKKFPKADLLSCLLNMAERGFEPSHIVDVGANRGKWSRKAHQVFPNCAFTLIEPQIEMKPHLDKFCRKVTKATWMQVGVGARCGELPFTVHPDTVSSSFDVSAADAKLHGLEQRMISLVTLDHLVDRVIHCIPEIVKIDAEGFEFEILKGAGKLLGKTEVIFLEAHMFGPSPNPCGIIELSNAMADFGYAPYDFTWFGKRPYDGAIGLCEIAYARKQGVLRHFYEWSANKAA